MTDTATRDGNLRRLTLLVFASALALYGLTAVLGGNFHHQELAYFNQLASAFLRGDLYLANPDGTHDLILYQSRWFVPFPPGPALLLLPFVALRGVDFNEVALSLVAGALNVALMFRLMQALASRGFSRLDQRGWLWLTALFAAGTVHWYVAATGTVSFLAHTLSVTGLCAALWLSIGLISVPLLLYYNTGWVQFGYRFSLDWLPLAFVLLAIGIKRVTPLVQASIVAAWLVNLWGVVWWFARFY